MVNKNTNKQCTNINSHQPSHPISPRPWGSADTTKILIAFSNNSSHGRHCNDVPDNDARQWCYSKSYFVKLVQFNCDAINSIFKPCPIIAAIIIIITSIATTSFWYSVGSLFVQSRR
jgi:hypothetical protein